MSERVEQRLRSRRAHDDRLAGTMRLAQDLGVADAVEDDRLLERQLALDRDLGHASARRTPPSLSHSAIVSPGSIMCTSTLGASSCSSCGVPRKTGNVPKWHGTQRFTPSSSSATAASFGPIV